MKAKENTANKLRRTSEIKGQNNLASQTVSPMLEVQEVVVAKLKMSRKKAALGMDLPVKDPSAVRQHQRPKRSRLPERPSAGLADGPFNSSIRRNRQVWLRMSGRNHRAQTPDAIRALNAQLGSHSRFLSPHPKRLCPHSNFRAGVFHPQIAGIRCRTAHSLPIPTANHAEMRRRVLSNDLLTAVPSQMERRRPHHRQIPL
jgi:hypothetical protein